MALKLTGNAVEMLKFVVPRKSEAFQEDLYPPTFSGVASHTADEWLAGSDKPPRLCSLDPAEAGKEVASTTTIAAAAPIKVTKKITDKLAFAGFAITRTSLCSTFQ